jgi:hypothetical protein
MLRRYAKTLRLRQALPPLFVLSLPALAILGLAWGVAWFLLLLGVVVYLVALLGGALPIAVRKKDAALAVGIPGAIAVMHWSWGVGFWVSFFRK